MASSKELRVGAFVLTGLFVTGVVVFLLGDEKRLFSPKASYHTSFHDVQGLKVGAPVRLGGVDIGVVSHVGHGVDPNDSRLYVDLNVVRSEGSRIRQSSVARIANKGLLGDKMIELDEGPSSSLPLQAGGTIRGQDPTDFSSLFSEVGAIGQKAQHVLENLETLTHTLADGQVQDDLRGSAHSLRLVLESAADGKGYLHRFLSDPAESDRISHLAGSLEHAAVGLEQTLNETQKLLARVNQGPGFAHDVIYGEQGTEALSQVGNAAEELGTSLKGIRESRGLAHSILYGGASEAPSRLADNLAATSEDLRHIMGDLRAGKGTLGALLVDPSVYEDVKRVLGDVQRNDALRALVRYSIKQDEKRGSEVGIGTPAKPAVVR